MDIKLKLGKFRFSATNKKPQTTELGSAGTTVWSGFIQEEYLRELKGSKAFEVYDRMRKSDGMIKAMLLALGLPLRSGEWFIKQAEGTNAEKVADFVDSALFDRMSITFDEFLQHVLLLNPFGFMIFEKVYKIENGLVYWKKLAPRLPKTIYKWQFDEEGGLKGIIQWISKGEKYQYIEIPIEKLIVFTNQREGSNYEGISVLRPAYKHWFIKDTLYKISAIGLERQAVGVPLGILAEGYTPEDKAQMEDIVENLRTNEKVGSVLPPGFDLKILEGKVKSTELIEHIKHHDTAMAKSILAQFLQLGQEDGGGSYALSADQSDFFMMNLAAQGKYICDVVNRYAIPQLVDYNFAVDDYPKLQVKLGSLNKVQIVEALQKLTQERVVLPDDELEEFMRDLMGLPKTKKDRTIREVMKPPMTFVEKKYKRALTKYEKGVNFQEIEDRFDKAEKALQKELQAIVNMQSEDILGQLEKILAAGKINELYQMTVRYRGKYADTLRSYLKDLVEFGKRAVEAEHKLPSGAISQELIRWINIKGDTLTELHAAKMKAHAMLTVLNSMNAGKSDKAILFDVKEAIAEWADRELRATASVSVCEAVNEGRQMVTYRDKDEFQAAQYSAVLDLVTCPLCEELDGLVIDLDNPDYEKFTPPLHQNCRCIWVMIGKEETDVEIDWKSPSEETINKYGGLIA